MKKIFHLIAVTISLVLLVGCISNNLGWDRTDYSINSNYWTETRCYNRKRKI